MNSISPSDLALFKQELSALPRVEWSRLSPQRLAFERDRLGPVAEAACAANEIAELLGELDGLLYQEDVCFLDHWAVRSLNIPLSQALMSARLSDPEEEDDGLCPILPYSHNGRAALPVLLASSLGAAAMEDPTHPRRAEFEYFFNDALSWAADHAALDYPLQAEDLHNSPLPADCWAALHFAAASCDPFCVEALLKAGASVEGYRASAPSDNLSRLSPVEEGSPLALACRRQNERALKTMALLLDAGADPEFTTITKRRGEPDHVSEPPLTLPLSRRWEPGAALLLAHGARLPEGAQDWPAPLRPREPSPFFHAKILAQARAENAQDSLPGEKAAARQELSRSQTGCLVPPLGFFKRLSMAAAIAAGKRVPLSEGSLALDATRASMAWSDAWAALVEGQPEALESALAHTGDSPKPADNFAWMGAFLLGAPGLASQAHARAACLSALAQASRGSSELKADFLSREPALGGMGVETFLLCAGPSEGWAALGPLGPELLRAQRGCYGLSALSALAMGARLEGMEAALRLADPTAYPPLSATDPGPLAIAIEAERFEIARAIAERFGSALGPQGMASALKAAQAGAPALLATALSILEKAELSDPLAAPPSAPSRARAGL